MLIQAIINLIQNLEVVNFIRLRRSEEGQGLVEYALILIFVAVMMIILITLIGPAIGNMYSNIVTQLNRGN